MSMSGFSIRMVSVSTSPPVTRESSQPKKSTISPDMPESLTDVPS